MRRSFLDSVLKGAEALAARDGVGTLADTDLLKRFAQQREPAAFAVLVRRHGPLVWGVCRNLLPADADAEDAFQATFLALVRSAGTIRQSEALAGWLHGVAYRVAMRARRAAARRKQRETKAAVPEPSRPVPDAAWDELQAAVHEEVCKLPDKLRLPFVLCTLQGRSQKEAAAALGWKVGTVSGRLAEARRKLLDRLAKRGVPAGVAVGAAVLGGVAGQAAVPAGLSSNALSLIGSPTTVPKTILSLARGVTPMTLTRTKLLAAGVLLAGALTGAGVLSTADAQQPRKVDNDEVLRRYYEALRTERPAADRFEYKFIPIDRTLSTAEMAKVLAGADREGWSYCGSQELANDKDGKIASHMVFKRPTGAAVSVGASADLRERADQERAAALRAVEAERAAMKTMEAERAKAERAARDAEAKARDLAEQVRRHQAEAEQQRDQVEKARQEALRALERAGKEAGSDAEARARQKELEAMKAEYEAIIRKMEAELKAKRLTPPPPKASDPAKNEKLDPNTKVSAVVKLQHIDAKAAVAALAKAMPDAHVVQQVDPDRVILAGPVDVVTKAREAIQKADTPPATNRDVGEDGAFESYPLKSASADDMVKVLTKIFPAVKFRAVGDNTVMAYGPPAVLKDLKKVIADLEKSREKSK